MGVAGSWGLGTGVGRLYRSKLRGRFRRVAGRAGGMRDLVAWLVGVGVAADAKGGK